MTHNHGVQRRIAKGLVAGLAVLVVLVGGLLWSAPRTDVVPLRAAQAVRIPVGAEPDGAPVALDADLYVPGGSDPAPAVVLAHGFGGDKADLRTEASRLAARGYVVLAYTSRGFGESGGRIHLMDPDYEVADAARVIDYLAGQDRVARSGGNDPRVAVVGGSYGGALALMAAARDQRVDAVVALITWNDLAQAFFPQAAQQDAGTALGPAEPIDEPGPYKQLWGANFLLGALGAGDAGNAGVGEGSGCGRFDPDLCRRFIRAAETGRPDAQLLTELRAHSPAPTLSQVNAPVYLIQGMSDTLFGLDQADASARALLAANAPVSVRWTNGGHDQGGGAASGLAAGGSASVRAEAQQVSDSIDLFLDRHLRPESRAVAALPGFTYAVRLRRGQDVAATYTLSSYADVLASSTRRGVLALPLRVREAATVVNPPGGVPSAITVVPGGLGVGAASYQLAALPGQHLALDSEVINADVLGAGVLDAAATGEAGVVAGAPRLSLEVTSSGREVSLYASLWQVQGGTARLLRPLTAAARVTVTPGTPQKVDLLLPMATWELAEGSRWRVLITTTDAAYRGTSTTRVDRVSLAEPTLLLPVARGATGSPAPLLDRESVWVLGLTGLLLAAGAVAALSARARARRADVVSDPGREDVLVVDGLTKVYGDGHRAVDGVSWQARRGQVVGLLGPNGAGKTTTLRMAVGLIRPDAGESRIRGQLVTPGAPVLRHVGTLIEGPGFVPHLSGRANLLAYWAATGRPAQEAGLEEALDVAALGGAIDRPVKSYSHGMKQRLGIAQAMLGRPDLLILDEPTNGLDPPQIAALRPILQRYAATGRTVVISSHLLGEVQLTCSHVIVMHAGRVIVAGAVQDLGVTAGRSLEEVFLETIAGVDPAAGPDADPDLAARTERLRQVRPR